MFDSAIAELSKQYNIVDIIDLNKFDLLDRKELYYHIKSCKRETFADDQRILIVASTELKQTFEFIPRNILIELQKCLQKFDIPHHFVIMITDIPSIKKDLDFLKRYTKDANDIECIVL